MKLFISFYLFFFFLAVIASGQINSQNEFKIIKNNTNLVNNNVHSTTFYKPTNIMVDNNAWHYINSYDLRGNLITSLYENFEDPNSTLSSRWSYIYNNNDSLTKVTAELLKKGEWIPDYREPYYYNTANKLIQMSHEKFIDSAWYPTATHVYTYDTYGRLLTLVMAYGEFGDSYTYEYDSQNRVTKLIIKGYLYGSWSDNFECFYFYDTQNNLIEKFVMLWNLDMWNNNSKSIYTYNLQNKMITCTELRGEDTNWVNITSKEYAYNSNGGLIQEIYKIWGDTNWVNKTITTYALNSADNILEKLIQVYSNGSLNNSTLAVSDYDIKGNCILSNNFKWVNQTWVPSSNYLCITYNNNTVSETYWGQIVEVQYTSITGVDDKINTPNSYTLSQNYPNPFNPSTTIKYSIPNSNMVSLKIFDVLGKEVTTLVNQQQNSGIHEVTFNAANLSSGTYFYQLKCGEFIETKKLLLLK
ncbi:MAG: T9SS type A sorting domain-containing protein [bacterium]